MVRSLIVSALAVVCCVVCCNVASHLEANDYLVGGQFNTPKVTHYRYRQTGQITYYGPRCCPPIDNCHTANYAAAPVASSPIESTPVTSSVYQPTTSGPAYNIRSDYTPYQLGQTVSRPRGWRTWFSNPFVAPVSADR